MQRKGKSDDETYGISFNAHLQGCIYRAREALWADFQTSVSSVQTPHNPSEKPSQAMVKIEKKYIFAGKEVTSVYLFYSFLYCGTNFSSVRS